MVKRANDANQNKIKREIHFQIVEDCLRQEAISVTPQNKNKIVLKLKLEKQISLPSSLKYEKQMSVSTLRQKLYSHLISGSLRLGFYGKVDWITQIFNFNLEIL